LEKLAEVIFCELPNWIRDATFNEDHIKTKAGKQAQIMVLLRSLGIELIPLTLL